MCAKQHDNGLPTQRISLLKRKTSTRFSLTMFPILHNLLCIRNNIYPQTKSPSAFKLENTIHHCVPFHKASLAFAAAYSSLSSSQCTMSYG